MSSWAYETFGPTTVMRSATRMNTEVAELLTKLSMPIVYSSWSETETVRKECADIQITLYRVAESLGFSLTDEVDAKMAINRARKWKLDGSGCGQHVE